MTDEQLRDQFQRTFRRAAGRDHPLTPAASTSDGVTPPARSCPSADAAGLPAGAVSVEPRTASAWRSAADRGRFAIRQCPAELSTRSDAELLEHLLQVPFDRARADEQLDGDLGIHQPFAGKPRDLRLGGGEVVPGSRPGAGVPFRR